MSQNPPFQRTAPDGLPLTVLSNVNASGASPQSWTLTYPDTNGVFLVIHTAQVGDANNMAVTLETITIFKGAKNVIARTTLVASLFSGSSTHGVNSLTSTTPTAAAAQTLQVAWTDATSQAVTFTTKIHKLGSLS